MRWMLRVRLIVAASIFAVLGVGLGTSPALAAGPAEPERAAESTAAVPSGVDDFSFASLDVEYTLTRAEDGTSRMRVVETFVAVFPEIDQNRGMRRFIPNSYLGDPLFPSLVSVTDENGVERPVETEDEDDFLVVTSRADEFVHGPQTYVFTYDLQNVTRAFDDTAVDELYWDVNGEEWWQPFGRVDARLVLDADLAAALTGDAACYQGSTGSTASCRIDVTPDGSGAVVTAGTQGELSARQTMTIAVAFEPGTFTPFDPSPFASPIGWLQGGATLLGVLAVVWAVVVRRRRLQDEPGRPTVIAEYEPPADLDALRAAVLWGAQSKGIPAEVLEQAIRGSIRIVEGERKWGSPTFELELLDRSLADENGRQLLSAMFRGSTTFTLGKSDTRVSRTAQKILKDADAALTAMGVRREVPAIVRSRPILVSILAGVATVIFGVFGLNRGIDPAWVIPLIIAAPVLLVTTALVVSRRPLTSRGAELRDHLAGVKLFIEWAEADRIRMLQSPQGAERTPISVDDPRQMLRLYERLLPYAVVFGQEKKWAERIVVYYGDSQPSWYYGSSAFSAAAFSSSISSLSASTSSTSSSSSSGGSSGGGSAGGGGGGGGGGGV